uniref:Uncharacterized protein n=1 Tax=Macaca fascicularis TaxID=9541 RepID=A0A7N9IG18_MACFA
MRRRGALRAGTRVFLPLAVQKQQAAWTAVAELVWNVCGQLLEPDAFSSEVNGASAQHMNSQRLMILLGLPTFSRFGNCFEPHNTRNRVILGK